MVPPDFFSPLREEVKFFLCADKVAAGVRIILDFIKVGWVKSEEKLFVVGCVWVNTAELIKRIVLLSFACLLRSIRLNFEFGYCKHGFSIKFNRLLLSLL